MRFYVIDKRTGKEPIFDGNHIFKEKWCKGRLIEFDIDGWYISEDGQLALVDDCCNMAYPPPDRYEIVFEEPTVCDIDAIRAEIEDLDRFYDNDYFSGNRDSMFKCKEVLQIIDKHTKGADE